MSDLSVIFRFLMVPTFAKVALVALLIGGSYLAVNKWRDGLNEVTARAMNWKDGDMDRHRGPKWQAPGTGKLKAPTYYTDAMSDVYIWRAKFGHMEYLLIGREDEIMNAHPVSIRGWGLDSKSLVKDVAKPVKLVTEEFVDRAQAQEYLRPLITERAFIPLTGGHERGKVNGEMFNITNAVR